MNTTMTALPDRIIEAIADAPRFAVIGLSMRDEAFRQRAAIQLATFIADRLERPLPSYDADQLNLPLPMAPRRHSA
jgi:hypothetical protein